MRFGDYGEYLTRRWDELGGEAATEAVRQRTGARTERDMPWDSNPDLAQKWANEFKDAQCGLFVQIAGELHHTQGHRDVGLGSKSGGNHYQTANGPIATDIIVLKDLDGGPEVQLVDCFSSMAGPESKPRWDVIEANSDRSWLEPPVPDGAQPQPPQEGSSRPQGTLDEAVMALARAQAAELLGPLLSRLDALEAHVGQNVALPTKLALRDVRGQYLCADQDYSRNVPILANRTERGTWETFTAEWIYE